MAEYITQSALFSYSLNIMQIDSLYINSENKRAA